MKAVSPNEDDRAFDEQLSLSLQLQSFMHFTPVAVARSLCELETLHVRDEHTLREITVETDTAQQIDRVIAAVPTVQVRRARR